MDWNGRNGVDEDGGDFGGNGRLEVGYGYGHG